jgi:hypothetical protein
MRRYLVTLLGLMAVFGARAGEQGPPVENFFKSYSYSAMILSPSGRFLAVLYPSNETTNVAILDIDGKRPTAITNYAKTGRVTWIHWKSDDRLLFGLLAIDKGLYRSTINAIGRDGSDLEEIAVDKSAAIIDWLHNQPNYILLATLAGQRDHVQALRVFVGDRRDNSISFGDRKPLPVALAQAPNCTYKADHNGEVRVCTTSEADSTSRILYREPGAEVWREVARSTTSGPGFIVLGFTPDNKALYVLSNERSDTLALYEFNPATASLERLLFEQPDADLNGAIFSWDQTLLGVEFTNDRSYVHFMDPNARQLQTDLSAEFPGEGVDIVRRTSMESGGYLGGK